MASKFLLLFICIKNNIWNDPTDYSNLTKYSCCSNKLHSSPAIFRKFCPPQKMILCLSWLSELTHLCWTSRCPTKNYGNMKVHSLDKHSFGGRSDYSWCTNVLLLSSMEIFTKYQSQVYKVPRDLFPTKTGGSRNRMLDNKRCFCGI
jgi:hypothetical protein